MIGVIKGDPRSLDYSSLKLCFPKRGYPKGSNSPMRSNEYMSCSLDSLKGHTYEIILKRKNVL